MRSKWVIARHREGDSACKKNQLFSFCCDNLCLTFGLRPPRVLFISDLASCLPEVVYQYLCHPLSSSRRPPKTPEKHQAGLGALIVLLFICWEGLWDSCFQHCNWKNRGVGICFCRDDLGTWCARNSLTGREISRKSVLWSCDERQELGVLWVGSWAGTAG